MKCCTINIIVLLQSHIIPNPSNLFRTKVYTVLGADLKWNKFQILLNEI